MTDTLSLPPRHLTGRIDSAPSDLLHAEVLRPQFAFDVEHTLPHLLLIEKVLLVESRRLGILDAAQVGALAAALGEVTPASLAADPATNMSDVVFAVERFVLDRVPMPVPAWHVDRSRNDLQACAQLMYGRGLVLDAARHLLDCATAALPVATAHLADPMPGYTHLQPAQVITPGFFLSAVVEHLLHTLDRLGHTYDRMNLCPLGSGAMSGQEIAWDRARMAGLLGFAGPRRHALVGVASREWVLEVAADAATFGIGLSRLVTDLMAWTSGEYGLFALPDAWSAISSAMPQKKNYPILERIRGKTAHLLSWYVDAATAQRGTPYSNSVEVSKESGAGLSAAMATLGITVRLFTAVLDGLTVDRERARGRCAQEYLGGFSLATALTLNEGVPWRDAQVISGRYVVAARRADVAPGRLDRSLLRRVAAEHGYPFTTDRPVPDDVFDPDAELRRRDCTGSASPAATGAVLAAQRDELSQLGAEWRARATRAGSAGARIDGALADHHSESAPESQE